ncbi:MerR family transcriptional regulator [Heyndrickxia coagulans]|uniref:MerR family transcriptional regulator n=1 Tax=Heyndrickxia coagulans TaxID=1398 RepID=UPI003D20EF87
MRIKEVAELAGVSIRTLRHYDDIGLLKPAEVSPSGYRHYSEENLKTLQQILFFKELGFPLQKIKEIIESPSFDRIRALELQRHLLIEKQKRLAKMIALIEKTIQSEKEGMEMSSEEKFAVFRFDNNPYEREAREKWGDQAVNAAEAGIAGLTGDEKSALAAEMNGIYRELAAIRHTDPRAQGAQIAIRKWFDFLNRHFGNYTSEAFKGLGQMYIEDSRFTKNIDQFGEGLATFMAAAMAEFANQTEE